MKSSDTALDGSLRRTLRDFVALSTLPAIWAGKGPEEIAHSLADALIHTLSLDLIYVRLARTDRDNVVEVARSKNRHKAVDVEEIRAALAPSLTSDLTGSSPAIPNPFEAGTLRLAVTRFGISDDYGILVTGSSNGGFPTEQDRLLLGVAANQTASVLRRQRAEERTRDQQEWMRVTLASIGDAVIATDMQGRVTLLNGVAEELTGWSQQAAQGQHLETVCSLLNEQTRHIENPVTNVLRDGTIVALPTHTILLGKDGHERSIDASAAPIRHGDGKLIGVVLTFRDVTRLRQAERYRNARLAVTQELSEAANVEDGAGGVLKAVCEKLNWDVGLFWMVSDRDDVLACRSSWHTPVAAVDEFVRSSCDRTFVRGQGLPGRVWASDGPAWILDIDHDENFARLSSAVQNGLHSAFAFPIITGEETLGVIEFFSSRIREPDADLLEMMGTVAGSLAQFIERKAAEESLRRSERELADFFENATVGLHWVGPDGIILRANQAELEMLGYRREEYVGRHITEFHADEGVICDILSRLAAGESLCEYPARLRCKDGSIKDVLIDSSVLWSNDQFVHTRCFTRDITERKRADTALSDTRSRLDAALEAGAISTWDWDIPNNRLHADHSLARLFNLADSDAEGGLLDKYLNSIHPDDLSMVVAALNRSAEVGQDYEADYRIVQTNGSIRWVAARGRPQRDSSGRPVRMPGVLVDITERKQLEEELRDAGRRKDEFLATLAHELRNPLAPLRTSLQILKMPRVDAATVEQTKDMMERQVHHLVRLVDDLLDVSRVTRGKIELRREPVELATVVARAIETVQPLIEIQRHRLEVSLAHDSLLLDADPVRLAQVIANLLTNAAKYTEPDGHIALTANREGHEAVLRVRDNGIGISPDLLPLIFDLFVQADHAAARSQGGLGIGLTLVKNLLQLHGGNVTAHSAGLGRGCEFVVRLPLIRRHPQGLDQVDGGHQNVQLPGHKLLVVDDNRDAAISLATLLRMKGHVVQVAHDGPSALEAATAYRPAMIFLDIGMPGMDGYEVARTLRKLPGLGQIILTALTGWGQPDDRRRTAEAGFDHHLVKPPAMTDIENLLAQLNH